MLSGTSRENRCIQIERLSISGVAVDIDEDGALKVMLSDGSLRTVNAGEVTVQGIY